MKYIFKISCLFLGGLMFVFACEQEPKQLSTVDDIFPSDIDTLDMLRPQALRVIPYNTWSHFTKDSIVSYGFAFMSQDGGSNKESIITEDVLLSWLRDSISGSAQSLTYSDDTITISGGNSVVITGFADSTLTADTLVAHLTSLTDLKVYRQYDVTALSEIYSNTFPIGSRIVKRDNSAPYVVQADSISGYTTDSIAVIPTGGNYAVLDQPDGIYPVKWFGAAIDSVTNDTLPIRRAINYTTNAVYFGPGDYLVNGQITLKNNVKLIGAKGARLYKNQSAGSSVWFNANGKDDVTLEGLTLINYSTSNFQQMVNAENTNRVTIKGCYMELVGTQTYGFTQHAVLARGSRNIKIQGNHLIQLQIKLAGATAGCQNAYVTDNYIETPYNLAISSVVNGSVDDTIRNHYIERNIINSAASQGGIFIGGDGENADPPYLMENIYIRDNVMYGPWADPGDITTTIGINVRGGVHLRNIDITGNRIDNTRTTTGNTIGIDVSGGDSTQTITNLRVDRNDIGRMDKWGVRFIGGTVSNKNISISDNHMVSNRSISFAGTTGGRMEGISMSGNYNDSITSDGFNINLNGRTNGFQIFNNVFVNPTTGSADAIDIVYETSDSVMGMKIFNNTISKHWLVGVKLTNTGVAPNDIFAFANTNLAATRYSGVTEYAPNDTHIGSTDLSLTASRTLTTAGFDYTMSSGTFGDYPSLRLSSTRADGRPYIYLSNTTKDYQITIEPTTYNLAIGSGTTETIQLETGTTDNQLYFPSGGGFWSGTNAGTARWQFQHTSNFDMQIATTSTSGVTGFSIKNGDQEWTLTTEGNNNDQFALEDETSGAYPITILKGSGTNTAIYINSNGETQFGTATDQGAFRTQVNGNSYVSGELNVATTTDQGAYVGQFNGAVWISGRIRLGSIDIINGTGSPEGAVTAPAGSMYLNTSAGASTTLYIKESGAGNTGWIAK